MMIYSMRSKEDWHSHFGSRQNVVRFDSDDLWPVQLLGLIAQGTMSAYMSSSRFVEGMLEEGCGTSKEVAIFAKLM